MKTIIQNSNIEITVLDLYGTNQNVNNWSLLDSVVSDQLLLSIMVDCLSYGFLSKSRNSLLAVSDKLYGKLFSDDNLIFYSNGELVLPDIEDDVENFDPWIGLLSGRYLNVVDNELIDMILGHIDCDVLAINVEPELKAYHEKISLTSNGNVAGFRRVFTDTVAPASMPSQWPHRLYFRKSLLKYLDQPGVIQLDFRKFTNVIKNNSLTWHSFKLGGVVFDLEDKTDFLDLVKQHLVNPQLNGNFKSSYNEYNHRQSYNCDISDSARLYGGIVLGKNIKIGDKSVILGPSVIGDNVTIEPGAIVRTSIIKNDIIIPSNSIIDNRIVLDQSDLLNISQNAEIPSIRNCSYTDNYLSSDSVLNHFKIWPYFSYCCLFKRLADMLFSFIALILLLPLFLIVAVLIKLTSRGPVFFRDKRQGLHGREFKCLKFRTMIVDAPDLQSHLRVLNQVDGPQFSIENDPRTSPVGKFLRDSFIDEIPQFINVFMGDMSLVGPRPSPESENILSPTWRDARLSVRPGVTGLWQACRTRCPHQDFQEWIAYDKTYVKNVSLKLDIWICCLTVIKIFESVYKIIKGLFVKSRKEG